MQTCAPLECSQVGFRSQSIPVTTPSSLHVVTLSYQDEGMLKELMALLCQLPSVTGTIPRHAQFTSIDRAFETFPGQG